MHLPTDHSQSLAELSQRIRDIADQVLETLIPAATTITLAPSSDLFGELKSTQVFLLRSGQVHCHVGTKTIVCFEPGDLLGLPRTLGLPSAVFSATETITVQPIERDELIRHVCAEQSRQKNWSYYLIANLSWYQQALALEIRKEFHPNAGFLHFKSGDIIIRQEDEADLVYTLLEGQAEAVCEGVTVGHINRDEIFGALAVFTGQKRMANVIATTDCTVLTVRKEEFIELVEHQPHICIGLIEEMADKIKNLNKQLRDRH
ncbi:cyclic nucleotide-binding domain-containing protein [Gilvimarinus polysaccharolyticus]|uniref:cyclic nucleotide-binding domain-containing protein n=1 Tax=Gilvimarinus polysaccharolyticus TaxID=863921 RepID=UPI000673288D|nr:cyclic nucleotide-binding domain-containing protein [Gilvimarinus polysaccharolyticus]